MPSFVVAQGDFQAGKYLGKISADDLAWPVPGYEFRRPVEGGNPAVGVNGDNAGIDVVKDLLVEKGEPVVVACGLKQLGFRSLQPGGEH